MEYFEVEHTGILWGPGVTLTGDRGVICFVYTFIYSWDLGPGTVLSAQASSSTLKQRGHTQATGVTPTPIEHDPSKIHATVVG